MESQPDEASRCRKLFWLLVVCHVVLWTLIPALTYHNVPLDFMELRHTGHRWQLGSCLHPPLPSWILEGAAELGGGAAWPVYLTSELLIALCFWAVWRLGCEIAAPPLALLGACALECNYWFTMESPNLNNNVGLYPFWALTALFLYRALVGGKNRHWLAAGACMALGMLCKYSMATLIATGLLFSLAHPAARRCWRRAGPYLMLLAAAATFSPHFLWLVQNGFPSLEYAGRRVLQGPAVWGHLLCPAKFAVSQTPLVLPVALALLPLTGWRWRLRPVDSAGRLPRDFLAAIALGPFAIHLLLAGAANRWLRSEYGAQLWMFAGLAMLWCLTIAPTRKAIRDACGRCIVIGLLFAGGAVVHTMAAPYLAGIPLRMHWPGQTLSAEVQRLWRQRYDQPLPVVAGDWWLASNIVFHGDSRHQPALYVSLRLNELDMEPRCNDGLNDEELRRRGGVIVWDADAYEGDARGELATRFPNAEFLDPLCIPYQTGADIPPLRVGVALVPPGQAQPSPRD